MKLLIFILIVGLYIKVTLEKLLGNFVFFGRGQRKLPKYWSDLSEIKVSKNSKVYFPYHKYDNDPEKPNTTDEAKNYPLTLFLSGKNDEEYSEIRFNTDRNDDINFKDYTYFKSELKFRIPKAKYLVNDGYTCENIGLSCTDLSQYDFSKNNEWLNLIDFKIFFEDREISESTTYSNEEKKNLNYELTTFGTPTTEWKEHVAKIEIKDSNLQYTSLVFRNYGKMPVYVSIGNSIFVKSNEEDIIIVKNGKYSEGFENMSWYKDDDGHEDTVFFDQVYPEDPEQKTSIYFSTKEDFNYAMKVEIKKIPTFGPPEAVSFKYRPMKDTRLNLTFNRNLTLSIVEYLNARNCRTIQLEENTILVDLKYYILTDSKLLMDNNVNCIWIQTVTDIEGIKKQLFTEDEIEKNAYVDDLYFYDLTFHNNYPTDLSPYTLTKLYSTGECDPSLHSHDYISSAKKRWPEDITFEKMIASKNIVEYIDPNENINEDVSFAYKNIISSNYRFNIFILLIVILYYIFS
ncbi:hypothetical protein PIROE2DRAFT_58674 [Piromyces sp. E2]|nr:hypothetical protein PIROE2DRAFT_58674 [Piromyces sp. E2]|eukprot:OUM67638.1 hypothetical protein PIROE2DRAFT_58674 [Piromyces sp. E2]